GHRDGAPAGRHHRLSLLDVSGNHGSDVQYVARLWRHRRLRRARVHRLQDVREDNDDRHITVLAILALCIVGGIVLACLGTRGLLNRVPQDERSYQDPLPLALKTLWPLVTAAPHVMGPRLKSADLEKSHRALQSAGQDFLVSPEELAGLRIVAAGVVVGLLVWFVVLL